MTDITIHFIQCSSSMNHIMALLLTQADTRRKQIKTVFPSHLNRLHKVEDLFCQKWSQC